MTTEEMVGIDIEQVPVAAVKVDEDGRISCVNASFTAVFGYTKGELLGKAVEVLVPPKTAGRHHGFVDGYLQNPRLREMGFPGSRLQIVHANGRLLPVRIGLGPIGSAVSYTHLTLPTMCVV